MNINKILVAMEKAGKNGVVLIDDLLDIVMVNPTKYDWLKYRNARYLKENKIKGGRKK